MKVIQFLKWITLIIGFLAMAHVALAAGPCGTLTVTSRANIYTDAETSHDIGFAYPRGTQLRIASIEGGMARITWRSGNGVEPGEGFIRRSSFDRRAFDAMEMQCAPRQPFLPEGETAARPSTRRNGRRNFEVRTNDDYTCLPRSVVDKLNEMEARGWDVQLVSAHRSRRDNARRGGARNSMHIQCRAADFLVNGVDRQTVENYLINSWHGGLGLYCSGRFHIDDGSHRMWGNCSSASDRRRYASGRNRRRGGSTTTATGAQP